MAVAVDGKTRAERDVRDVGIGACRESILKCYCTRLSFEWREKASILTGNKSFLPQ